MKYCVILLTLASELSYAMIEPLYGIRVGNNAVTVKVESRGCTSVNHFELDIRHHRLIITRKKPDACRGTSKLVELTLPLRDTLKKPKLYNPLYVSLEPVFAKNSID